MRMHRSPVFVSTACVGTTEQLDRRISDLRNHGLVDIELGAGVTVNFDDEDLRELPVGDYLIHNYFPPPLEPFVLNLASKEAKVQQQSLQLVCKALELSAKLHAPFYSVHAGFITDPTGFGTTSFIFPAPTSSDEAHYAMERFVASLQIALDVAQRLDIQILIENNVCSEDLRGKLLLQSAEEFHELFRSVQSAHLGVLLDTGHLNVTSHTLSFDRMNFADQVAPYVKAFHIHDNDGVADLHQPVGASSWVFDVLNRPEYALLPLTVEARFANVSELYEHVNWLKGRLGRA
jgi:sugar phosphate isomerase/epimerase